MKRGNIAIKKYVFKALVFLFASLFSLQLQATVAINDTGTVIQHPFDTIKRVKEENRVEVATQIYKRNHRHVKEALAMNYLDQLSALARQLDDKSLESVVFDFKADYYAVNNAFNNLSITYYQKAINFASDNGLTLETAIYLHHAGMFYYNFKHNTTACLYFLKSQEEFKKVGFDKVPNMVYYYSQVADFYYHLGDYANAKAQLKEALKYKLTAPRDGISITNTTALIYRSNHQYPEALIYFNKALELARKNKDTVWMGIANGNIGSVYFMQDDYGKALPYIQTDYSQSLKYNEKINATIALLRIVKINLVNNKTQLALKQLDTAELLIQNRPAAALNLRVDILDLKAQCYDKMGLFAKSLIFRNKYEAAKDSLTIQNNIAAVDVVKMQYVIGKQLAEESKLKAKAKVEANERNAVFIILFLLLIITVLVYSRQALKTKKDKLRVDEELKYTALKLDNYTENLRKNNKLIESFKQQIEHLKSKNADNAVVEHLEELMQAHIMTDSNWMEFKKIFLKVYPNFFFNLKKSFLHLSEGDIRLLTLIRLQSSNKEMANMLGITLEGVKKAKQRLRKKMNLDDNTTIEDAILKI
jgi:tetratricopeptide (TPR) repeat protein